MKRHILIILLLAFGSATAAAQENELKLGLRAGYNAAFGCFSAASLETIQTFGRDFSVNGGIQYNTIGKTALEARPAYDIKFGWARLTAEVLLSYTNQSSIHILAAGFGARLDFGAVSGKLGYHYRTYGGKGGQISEPFNIYYDFRAHFLRKSDRWDLDLIFTNSEIFELERHYQPSFIAECRYYPMSMLGISLSVGCKPAGMFNMSADHYQSFLNAGACYRW